MYFLFFFFILSYYFFIVGRIPYILKWGGIYVYVFIYLRYLLQYIVTVGHLLQTFHGFFLFFFYFKTSIQISFLFFCLGLLYREINGFVSIDRYTTINIKFAWYIKTLSKCVSICVCMCVCIMSYNIYLCCSAN